MNIYLSVAFTLLATVAGMYLLAKTRAEALGKFFRFISWTVIIVAGLSLLCQLGTSACWMACSTGICTPSENCMPGMMGCHEKGDDDEECCEHQGHGCKSGGCEMKGDHRHGEGNGGCMEENEDENHEMKMDSSKSK